SYVNRTRRFNWGAEVDSIPYTTAGFLNGYSTANNGQQVYFEQTTLYRQVDRGASVQGIYPLDSTLRLEMSTGYRNIGYDTQIYTQGYSLQTGQQVFDTQESGPSYPGLNLWQSTAAIVKDSSVFGATSPVMGQRFRVEASPTVGSINYTGLL